jgi:hypothetical protein
MNFSVRQNHVFDGQVVGTLTPIFSETVVSEYVVCLYFFEAVFSSRKEIFLVPHRMFHGMSKGVFRY